MNSIYDSGSFTLSKQTMNIGGLTINLSNLDNLNIFDYPRHSLFEGLGEWFGGLIFVIIICAIWKKIGFVADIYPFTIILLIINNIKEYKKEFFGLRIETTRMTLIIKANDKDFIIKVRNAIEDAINSKKASYIINLDSHNITNNGIINKGNNNRNKVEKIDNK